MIILCRFLDASKTKVHTGSAKIERWAHSASKLSDISVKHRIPFTCSAPFACVCWMIWAPSVNIVITTADDKGEIPVMRKLEQPPLTIRRSFMSNLQFSSSFPQVSLYIIKYKRTTLSTQDVIWTSIELFLNVMDVRWTSKQCCYLLVSSEISLNWRCLKRK